MPEKINILHIEDNEDDAFLIERFLRKGGYDPFIKKVEDGSGMEQALESRKWDIILSDYSLPNYSGMRAVVLAKSKASDIPFIIVSGAIGEETAADMMRKGAADYVMKDNLSRLLPAIERELYEAENRKKSRETELAIQSMVKSVVGTEGSDCFEKTLKLFCGWTGFEFGFIGLLQDDGIQTISCITEENQSDKSYYEISGTPCQKVMEKGFYYHPKNVTAAFPKDKVIVENNIESYVGIALKDNHSKTIGVLCAYSQHEVTLPSQTKEYMEIVTAKVTAEIIHQKKEKENKALELRLRQAQKMEAIGTLAGGIAHDFNNILFPIIGYSEMLLEDTPEKTFSNESAKEILSSALRAKELVNQILTFSRQKEIEKRIMNIEPVLKEVLKLVKAATPSSVLFKCRIEKKLAAIHADPTQIHQLVMNLLTNAYQSLEDEAGEIQVNLTMESFDNQSFIPSGLTCGNYNCLSVSDTGIGMNEKTKERIFEPFFSTKKDKKGTGLGLSTVHGIVENMKGVVCIDSEPGKGTDIRVYLPIEGKTADTLEVDINKTDQEYTGSILLIDDEEPVLVMLSQYLNRLGYRTDYCINPLEALELFTSHPHKYDLVVTDYSMPDMTGDKLAVELLKVRADIPIILNTGYANTITSEAAQRIGVRTILTKPVVLGKFAETVKTVLNKAEIA